MTRKKRRRSRKPTEQPSGPEQQRRPSGRRWWLAIALIIVALGTVTLARVAQHRTQAVGRVNFPGPLALASDTGPSLEEFVGAEACTECHSVQYEAWKGSTHGNAGGPPSRERFIAPFNGVPIQFKDALVTPLRTEEGKYVFRVAQQGRPEQVFQVAWVVGGGHMMGGGTQAFFAEFPDGTLRFLPFDFVKAEGVWFCQTIGRIDQGWIPITPATALADCSDWPPARVLGSHERFWNCQQCHGSQIQLAFDAGAQRYETRFTTLAVNCESCHGPGRQHVEIAWAGGMGETADIGMRPLATLDKDESIEICFQCHALKEELQPGYLPGRPLQEYYGLKLPLVDNRPFFPDGRIRQFAYQQGHLYSDCYLNGSMTCVDCHDPHTQRYRDISGEPLVGRFSNGQCLGCHASKAEPLERHTHHRAASPGSRCVACHMPYLQEPVVGTRLRYARSDHTISIPRPSLDAMFGIENACQQCHADRSLNELDAQLKAWYGELKPLKCLVEGLIRVQRVSDRRAAARLLLAPRGADAVLQFRGLAYFFQTHLSPDMPALEAEIVDRLRQLSESDDADVQALALASLHFARGDDPAIRSLLADKLGTLGARDGAIRRRWVWMLDFRGDAYRERGEFRLALTSYQKAQEILPNDPAVLRDLGIASVDLGAYGDAITSFRKSLEINPVQPLTLVSLGFALTQRGDFAAGLAAYRQAIEMNPREPRSHLSLGNAYLRGGMVGSAVDAYERAVALDPSLSEAHFALGKAYVQQGRHDRAIAALSHGLEFDPTNASARQMLDALQR